MGLLDRIKLWVWLHGRALAWIAVIGVAFILAGGGFYVWKKYGESKHAPVVADASRPDVGEVLKMREAGQYDYAIQLIGDGLGRNPENRELAALRADFMEDLKVDFRLHYLRGQRLPEKTGAGSELAVSPASTYYYSVNPTTAVIFTCSRSTARVRCSACSRTGNTARLRTPSSRANTGCRTDPGLAARQGRARHGTGLHGGRALGNSRARSFERRDRRRDGSGEAPPVAELVP